MLYFVLRYIIPFEGNDSHSEEKFTDIVPAKKRWHTIIASDIDKTTLAYELIQIIREDGICVASEILDNRIPPEPEPTPNEGE